MSKFNKWQKGAMVALPLAIMLNPLTIMIYIDYVVKVLEVISGIAILYLMGFMLYKILKPETVTLPKKSAKTQKAGKYIET